MKNIKQIVRVTVGLLALLAMITACETPIDGPEAKVGPAKVMIRIGNEDGRTLLPQDPAFTRYELTVQKDGALAKKEDSTGIAGAGAAVFLDKGTWTITVQAYQELGSGAEAREVAAAEGSARVTISGSAGQTVDVALKPLPMTSPVKGRLTWNIKLPGAADTALMSLKQGNTVILSDINLLIKDNNPGRRDLDPGYYDLSIFMSRDRGNLTAGVYHTVHIYPGMVTPAGLDLSGTVFTDKVYVAVTFAGLRKGTTFSISEVHKDDTIETLETFTFADVPNTTLIWNRPEAFSV